MSKINALYYDPGRKPKQNRPLDRYLPPIRENVVASWLQEHVPSGSWILDPFGSSPEILVEAASCGYKVLTTINNPITRFILELRGTGFSRSEYQTAIAHLASTQVGRERLEPHIKSLYETVCESCGRLIQAEAFVWKRGAVTPESRIYTCPFCGDNGERTTTSLDKEKASQFENQTLHRARALERVTPLHDPDRRHVEEALEAYLPRAIYALVTIINKFSNISPDDPASRMLRALLLLAFDRANTLWPYPKARQRPKQLTIPPKFLEHNIWLAIETAADILAKEDFPISITKWPQKPPPQGGICLFEGRIKSMAPYLSSIDLASVITSFPRPNQAFWTLCALWSGWLWGPEALDQFKIVLRRRRYDWSWHSTAIQTAMNHLVPNLPQDLPYFGLINETEPGFLSSIILGCQLANLSLSAIALRTEDNQAQIVWQGFSTEGQSRESVNISNNIVEAAKEHLQQRGEPCPYLYIHAAALVGIASKANLIPITNPGDYLSQVTAAFHENLNYRNGFLRYFGSEKSLDVGLWWARDIQDLSPPLTDRVENLLSEYLLENPRSSFQVLEAEICKRTPGILPPSSELIVECLHSYGHADPDDSSLWLLNSHDHPEPRKADINEIMETLLKLGVRLGFAVSSTIDPVHTVKWGLEPLSLYYYFYISTNANLGCYQLLNEGIAQKIFIVIPGSRSNLIAYKLEKNPYLEQYFQSRWNFIKFRLIRLLENNTNITPGNIEEHLLLDPITYTTPQIRMF